MVEIDPNETGTRLEVSKVPKSPTDLSSAVGVLNVDTQKTTEVCEEVLTYRLKSHTTLEKIVPR